jgi:hypothetical protein
LGQTDALYEPGFVLGGKVITVLGESLPLFHDVALQEFVVRFQCIQNGTQDSREMVEKLIGLGHSLV